jgi:hypothetical protein
MAKIANDKYYSPQHIVDLVIERVKEVIGLDNITEFIEPSAGNGAFLDALYELGKPVQAYDLYPEREDIIEQDYLKLKMDYKVGRCILTNPPFGRGNSLSMAFYKKSINIADYIVFLLPISQFKNNIQLYDFDLIYSEDLGIKNYSNIPLNLCLNIYKKPKTLNKKPNHKLKDIVIYEYRRDGRELNIPRGYDYVMGNFGGGCVGRVPDYEGHFAVEYYFYIKNHKEKVLNVLKNTDWKSLSKGISNTYRLNQTKIYKHLKEQIPELE